MSFASASSHSTAASLQAASLAAQSSALVSDVLEFSALSTASYPISFTAFTECILSRPLARYEPSGERIYTRMGRLDCASTLHPSNSPRSVGAQCSADSASTSFDPPGACVVLLSSGSATALRLSLGPTDIAVRLGIICRVSVASQRLVGRRLDDHSMSITLSVRNYPHCLVFKCYAEEHKKQGIIRQQKSSSGPQSMAG
ncbi:hypothetical protein NUW54_g4322 [Trametes sanguinea]|uniref:Uncharacterized protein n=1 Tax=Trametes sanguinea TaxID=158606 RepID=A0ACC1PZW9_9APHY|nr:hypothetical protein NUW54_g4322 [Trametes sanguinea]